ncbi:MAG TPA: hypothetical protein VFS20_13805 [Longimicrobium sp.]|nr:hypothetical protein [Longimicrobium sp.]
MVVETLIAGFHELEKLAGVSPVKGRGWHGLRRDFALALDRVGEVEGRPLSQAERNEAGGWEPGSTIRDDVYRPEIDLPRLKRLAQVREHVRERNPNETPAPEVDRLRARVNSLEAALLEVLQQIGEGTSAVQRILNREHRA